MLGKNEIRSANYFATMVHRNTLEKQAPTDIVERYGWAITVIDLPMTQEWSGTT
jgi:uncharacterized membrane protein